MDQSITKRPWKPRLRLLRPKSPWRHARWIIAPIHPYASDAEKRLHNQAFLWAWRQNERICDRARGQSRLDEQAQAIPEDQVAEQKNRLLRVMNAALWPPEQGQERDNFGS